ncbi:MAG: outer membrane lipoprotein-sorting protein [Gammaproteobacteria bacterium]|nr:outer membrane lipoprotein-sorting protein [Gammaproteobacteria bacterium]
MERVTAKRAISTLLLGMLVLVASAVAAELTGTEIMQRAYESNRIDDQIATLTFTFIDADHAEKKVVYTMAWKNSRGQDGYDNKAMFFTEDPPDRKGIAYLGWLRPLGSSAQDDEWIYLPEMRMVRRIAKRGPHYTHDDEEFGHSLLERDHLQPRPVELDDHQLLKIEVVNGVNYYVVESRPKQQGFAYPYRKVISWVEQETLRPMQVHYFDMEDSPALDISFEWIQIDGKWIWKRVTAIEPTLHAKTILEISDVKINSGLSDSMFTSRLLMRGFVRP